jgi:hypothetical protein
MALIRSSCNHCQKRVEFPHTSVKVFKEDSGRGACRFTCPECHKLVTRNVDAEGIALMIEAGAYWVPVRHPDPITDDETRRFHDAIHNEDVFAAALAGLSEPRRLAPDHPALQHRVSPSIPARIPRNPLEVPVGAYVWDDLTHQFEQTAYEPSLSATTGRVTLAGKGWSIAYEPGVMALVPESIAEAVLFNVRRKNEQEAS